MTAQCLLEVLYGWMISMIDDAIGDILKTLDDIGEADNTIVIMNADHGDYMGAFSLLLKGPFAHMSVNRVPFVWADPVLRGRGNADGLAALIDIAPTIIERLGLTPYYGMQGRSFLDQLEGGDAGRDAALIEHEENKVYPGFEKRPNMRHLITDSHRMTIHKDLAFGELYDLRNDPDETYNLWDVPAAASVKAEMLFRLPQVMLDAIERSPWPKRFT